MTRHERILRAEPPEPETGRQLVRVGDAGVSLLERLGLRGLLSRRAPLRVGRARTPLRLVAVPRDPVAGDKAVGAALLDGRFVGGAQEIAIAKLDWADPALPHQIAERLHSFAWLRDLAAAAKHERGWKVAEQLTRLWLEAYGETVVEPAWRADHWGRRILFWSAYAPYILSTREPTYRGRLLGALAHGAAHVERAADGAPPGLARITAWSGALGAALILQGSAPKLARCEAGLARALRTGLHDDNGLLSRAPTQQLELVELLGLTRAFYAAAEHALPDWLADAEEGALSALLCVTSGDAGLSSWQGGNGADPHRVAAVIEGAAATTRPLRQARGWGYQRLQAHDAVLIMDAAPPPSARALTGGCASTLAFEYSDGPQRLVVNCGGAGAAEGQLPAELAHLLRTTAAHSTLILGDCNSTAIHADGALGRGVGQVEMERGSLDRSARMEATHDGYVRRFRLLHRRQLLLAPDGGALIGQDALIPQGRRRKSRGDIGFAIRFHLAPGVEVSPTADGNGALLHPQGASAWQFRCRGGALLVEDSIWLDGQAIPRGTLQLVIIGETPLTGVTVGWEFRRAGRLPP